MELARRKQRAKALLLTLVMLLTLLPTGITPARADAGYKSGHLQRDDLAHFTADKNGVGFVLAQDAGHRIRRAG